MKEDKAKKWLGWITIISLIILVLVVIIRIYIPFMERKDVELKNEVLISEIASKNDIIMENSFKIWEQKLIIDVMNDGATLAQAHSVIEYAMMFDIDVRTFSLLGASESGFKHIKHDLEHVIGIFAINTKAHPDLPFNVYTDSGNIANASFILRGYLDATDNNYLKALTKYKGNTKMGVKLASAILEKARKN